jgi:SAM-dependent methyltransferase
MDTEKLMKVDLCCGTRKPEGFVGVDYFAGAGVDIVANLNDHFPFDDNSVDVLRAHDAIEHLPNRIHTMNEIWRICKPNAVVDIFVPSTDGRGAFQDPTHVSYWNINSFLYYSVDHQGTLELCQRYGFQGAFKIKQLFNIGGADGVIHVQAILQVIK